jgi:putative transposase
MTMAGLHQVGVLRGPQPYSRRHRQLGGPFALALTNRGEWSSGMTTPARARCAGYRFPAEIISHTVWLYFRFPLGLRMVEELLAVIQPAPSLSCGWLLITQT